MKIMKTVLICAAVAIPVRNVRRSMDGMFMAFLIASLMLQPLKKLFLVRAVSAVVLRPYISSIPRDSRSDKTSGFCF